MNMKRLLTLVAFIATLQASAQQVNPVPDYVFSNRMSAGRNTVTDTAAYFSIGPRYGATRGMMPPMVVDTASFSANKRNGLLIFSVQKNKFLYWDSVGVKWAEMAGTGGSAITGSGVAGYMPEFTTATNLDTTRLYHSTGRFTIGSTTTTNGVFNVYGGAAYFDQNVNLSNKWTTNTSGNLIENDSTGVIIFRRASDNANASSVSENTFLGQSTLRLQNFTGVSASINIAPTLLTFFPNASEGMRLNTNNELLVNTQTDQGNFKLQVNGNVMVLGSGVAGDGLKIMHTNSVVSFEQAIEGDGDGYQYIRDGSNNQRILLYSNGPTWFNGGEVFIGSAGTDAGAYALQVTGAIYNTTTMTTGAPTGGSVKPWRLGEAATVSPTSPNRTIRVEIDGVVYYLHAKTTND